MNINDVRKRLSANADKYAERIKELVERLKRIEGGGWKSFVMMVLSKNRPGNISKEITNLNLFLAEYQKAVQGIDNGYYSPAIDLMDKICKSIRARGFMNYGFYPPPALGRSAVESYNVLVDAAQ